MKKRLIIILAVAALLIAGTVAAVSAVPTDEGADVEAVALAHAGVTDPQWIRSEYDVDDGIPQWEIEFYADGWEYDYTVHAETGAVLKYDKEQEAPAPTLPAEPVEPTPPAEPDPPADPEPSAEDPVSALTAGDAESLALAHAGLTADQVTRLHSEYDVDDGVPQYEIEFHHDGWEYEYEVHGETGKILHSEKDWDD